MRVLLLAFAVLLAPAMARGDDLALAKAAVAQGARLFDAHRYAEAKAQFERADALAPNPRLAFNIGLCEEKLGHEAAAAEDLDSFMSETASDPRVPEVNHRIALSRLEALGRKLVRVSVVVVPPTASLTIDGVASRPGVRYLARGTPHHVHAEAPAFASADAEIPASASLPQSLKLVLEPAAPPPAVAEEKPAPRPAELPPQVLAPAPKPEAPVVRNHLPAYIAFGVGAASAAACAYFGITAAVKAGQIPASCESNSSGPGCDGYGSYHTDATLADVFGGVAIAGGAAGGLLWAFAPAERGAGAQVQVGTRF